MDGAFPDVRAAESSSPTAARVRQARIAVAADLAHLLRDVTSIGSDSGLPGLPGSSKSVSTLESFEPTPTFSAMQPSEPGAIWHCICMHIAREKGAEFQVADSKL